MTEPIKCRRGDCQIEARPVLFGGYCAHCLKCKKLAGIKGNPEAAIAEWNRWVEIGGFIDVVKVTVRHK